MGRGTITSSSSSSIESTDLRLGLSLSTSTHRAQEMEDYCYPSTTTTATKLSAVDGGELNENPTLFVKVNMEGIPIGRKLDLLAHQDYHDLITTLDHMFNTNIVWGEEMDEVNIESDHQKCHVLTYEDEEGDWMMVGDVPWEMFLSTVKRLKITRAFSLT